MSLNTGSVVNWWIASENFSDTASTNDLSDFEDNSSISGGSSAKSEGGSDSDSDAPSIPDVEDWTLDMDSDYYQSDEDLGSDLGDGSEDTDGEPDDETNMLIFRESAFEYAKPPLRASSIGHHPTIPVVESWAFTFDGHSFLYRGHERYPPSELKELIDREEMWKLLAWGIIDGKCEKVPERISGLKEALMAHHEVAMKDYHEAAVKWESIEWEYDPVNLVGRQAEAWSRYLQEKRDWETREWETWAFHDRMRMINGFTVDPQFAWDSMAARCMTSRVMYFLGEETCWYSSPGGPVLGSTEFRLPIMAVGIGHIHDSKSLKWHQRGIEAT
ncbi:hypothetical protein QBC37DRAFT_401908 [Rhypophila decipiens]|uniref:Uncharacterized protein n=1 Tax=Rhypophila decipiens TaxID=261697 RepID=A0AAN6Y3N7_9PEZI|nr:hypothetical protein QBC37DRAFT_401908 [Rhypophila decipiens]